MSLADVANPWHDLYALVGAASATLIGLLFVAASVGAGFFTHERHHALRAFLSPSVVHFSCVLAACLVGGEFYVRDKVKSCMSSQFQQQLGTQVSIGLGAKPVLLDWMDKSVPSLTLDSQGNQFYYAHLSAFSTTAVNGAHVKAGQVIGFMGNTGDARGTPYHLHFEVHLNGVPVNPRPYLGI